MNQLEVLAASIPWFYFYYPWVLLQVLYTKIKARTTGTQYRKWARNPHVSGNLTELAALFDLPPPVLKDAVPGPISNYLAKNKSKATQILGTVPPHYNEAFGAYARWYVKRNPEDLVILFLHGGGYLLQMTPAYLEAFNSIIGLLPADKRNKVSVLILDYDLASTGAAFPRQLQQAYDTYTKLLEDGYTNIGVMGDSAGGHLTLTLLQQLKARGSPVYPNKIILLSPWTKLLTTALDHVPGNLAYDNDGRDAIRFLFASNQPLVSGFIGTHDVLLAQVLPGNADWATAGWDNIPSLTLPKCDVFFITGEDELFLDQDNEFAYHVLGVPFLKNKYGNSNGKFDRAIHEYIRRDSPDKVNVWAYVEPWGIHNSFVLSEDDLAEKVAARKVTIATVDRVRYFAIPRIVDFLYETI